MDTPQKSTAERMAWAVVHLVCASRIEPIHIGDLPGAMARQVMVGAGRWGG